jgi:hypothetical protein
MFYSQSINSWPTKTGLTITDNNAISPDGTQNASYIQQTVGGATVNLVSAVVTVATAQPQSVSFYAKAGQVTSVTLQVGTPALWVGSTRVRFTIDLLTGVITITTGTGTASSVAVGNGWYKYSVVTAATIGSGTTSIQTVTGAVFSPNSGDGFYLWGAQWEQNTSTPTSYIPTTTAAVTRNTETILNTTATALIGQSEGTLYWDIAAVVGVLSGTGNPMFGVRNSGTTNWVSLTSNTPSSPFRITAQATTGNLINYTVNITSGKAALAWSSAGLALYVNGSLVATSATNPNFSFSVAEFFGYAPFKANAFAIYPNRIPNTAGTGVLSLQSLTQ